MKKKESVYGESSIYSFFKSLFTPSLRPALFNVLPSIIYNFFLRQYHSAFLPGKIPVSKVDHPLDKKIPFVPSWVTIYIDFAQFWIRVVGFFSRRYKRKAYKPVVEFINSTADLYVFAAEVYTKHLSTTKRPFYISRPRFFMIHILDPHLFCVPSLHVMIVIHTYIMFSVTANKIGCEDELKEQAQEMKDGALAISQAILYVKQHSVNCIPAALYAMTCFMPEYFPPKEAEDFTNLLFSPAPEADESLRKVNVHPSAAPSTKVNEEDQTIIKKHILDLYYRFLEEKKTAKSWEAPLINFMKTYKTE